ncbi:amidohydrolase family protein [Actinomadura hibisca]|uniref:amidohydrolase family protein n=1 Tax=Actinomadura hibisca TaxID=68565 RepID=UPI00082CBDB6|nr:amidohydrolase family protein [Actinomadura hibisca]
MTRTALTGVRVFDGHGLSEPGTVVIDGAVIGTDVSGARTVDASGAVLLPGLIDAHVHLHGPDDLRGLAAHGVTTGLDMATWPPDLLASLREVSGLSDFRSAGTPVIGPGGPHARIPGMAEDAVIHGPEQAADFVAARIAQGSDYIKVVLEEPGQGGPDRPSLDALVAAVHEHGRLIVAHAAWPGAYRWAVEAGVDVVTHIPLGQPLDAEIVERMASAGQIAVPTLTMMEGIASGLGMADAFTASLASVAALHRAGVPVLAGTDANHQQGVPFQPAHGASLHHELELLVRAGLSEADALRAATVLPARHFQLTDRGAVESGLRADLLLIDGDPLADISATRKIVRVWCGGVEQTPA